MTHPTPEAVLCSAYQEQSDCYRRAAESAASLTALIRDGLDHSRQLEQVMALLGEAAAIEQRIGPLKARWVQDGNRVGRPLRAILSEATQRIALLAQSLAEAEREATQRHSHLAPQLDAMIRGGTMRRAYRFA